MLEGVGAGVMTEKPAVKNFLSSFKNGDLYARVFRFVGSGGHHYSIHDEGRQKCLGVDGYAAVIEIERRTDVDSVGLLGVVLFILNRYCDGSPLTFNLGWHDDFDCTGGLFNLTGHRLLGCRS